MFFNLEYNQKILCQMLKIAIVILALVFSTVSIMPRTKAFEFSAQAVMPDLSFKTISLKDY